MNPDLPIDVRVNDLVGRMKLGMFDPPERVKRARIPYSVNDSSQNARLAEETDRKSNVLLKNQRDMLPLRKNLRTIPVIGPSALRTGL
jgi:beta-glucosidase